MDVNGLLLRRRELTMGKKENPYEGFTFGRIYSNNITRRSGIVDGVTTADTKVSPPYEGLSGHTIVYNYDPNGTLPKDIQHTDYAERSMLASLVGGGYLNGSSKNGYNGARNSNVKNVAELPENVEWFVAVTNFPLDDFFIYDRTAGVYIYRGKNVIADYQ